MNYKFEKDHACNLWIHAQRLNQRAPFGKGHKAVSDAISHLGYVQIDTINVIERCHHHILYNRIPAYHPNDLHIAQTKEKSVFEYWTHALSYVPSQDFKYFIRKMKKTNADGGWFGSVTEDDFKKVKTLLRQQGTISIRDIKDDVLVEKTHAWASSKPSKRALQLGFFQGHFVVAEREGMLKKYALTEKHFGWKTRPKMCSEAAYAEYILERALRSQAVVSLDSVCYLEPQAKKLVSILLEKKSKTGELLEVHVSGISKEKLFVKPDTMDEKIPLNALTHILSPFDPLIIQRKRLRAFFEYEHIFEAYVPKEKRKFGYFTLPVLHQNNFIALLDLKADRTQKRLLIQNWVWLGKNKSLEKKKLIETELDRFQKFQFLK